MIFITGANGFVGSYIVKKYIDAGYAIKALKRSNSDLSLLGDYASAIEWVEGDLNNLDLVEVLRGVDKVIHSAAVVSFNKKDHEALFRVNVIGTKKLVDASLATGVKKFIHVSSIASLGRKNRDKPLDEKTKWEESDNNSYYAKSKYLAELEVWKAIEEGMQGFIVNPSLVLGGGDWNKSSTAFFKKAYYSKGFYVKGYLNFVDVRDVCEIIYQLDKKGVNEERYVLNAGNISYKEAFTAVAHEMNRKIPSYRVSPVLLKGLYYLEALKSLLTGAKQSLTKELLKNMGLRTKYDNSKVIKELGYQFRTFEETVKWTCDKLKNFHNL